MRLPVAALAMIGVALAEPSPAPRTPLSCGELPAIPSPPPAMPPFPRSLDKVADETFGDLDDGDSGGTSANLDPATQLSRVEIIVGMIPIRPRVKCCHAKYQVDGLANVRVVIGRDGVIRAAHVLGTLAKTPTADCVEKAVKLARFPKFSGSPIQINYPFMLR
jgi:hypothetical protein